MENTILELVDRLLALQARYAVAEDNLKTLEEQFHQLEDAIAAKNDRIKDLEKQLADTDSLYHYVSGKQYAAETALEKVKKELAALKEEAAHVSEV